MHRLPTHHSTMHLPRSYHPYIFPTTPTTIHTTSPYSIVHQYFLQHTKPSTITTINHDTLVSIQKPPLHPYPQSLYTSQNTTTHSTTLHRNNNILPSKCTSLRKFHIHKHKTKQSNSSQHRTAKTHNRHNPHTTHSTKLTTLNLYISPNTPSSTKNLHAQTSHSTLTKRHNTTTKSLYKHHSI